MSKKTRQYIGLLSAIIAYYIIHEGAHLVYALITGVFKEIKFMGLGMQIDIYSDRFTDRQLCLFCIVGSAATFVTAYLLVFLADKIVKAESKPFKACMYYITIAMLLLDPLYLSLLCGFFGGGDMNGITLLFPEITAHIGYGVLLIVNVFVFIKVVLSKYKAAFEEDVTKNEADSNI